MFLGVVLYVVDNGGPQLPQMQSVFCQLFGNGLQVWDTGMGMGYRYGFGIQVWDTGVDMRHRYGYGTQV